MQKTLIILAAILSLAAAGLGFQNRDNLLKVKEALSAKTSEADAANKKNVSIAAELKASKEKEALANTDAESKVAAITDLTEQKTKLTSALADIQKQSADKDAAVTQMKTDMAAKDARITELQNKINASSQPGSDPTVELKKQLEEKDILTSSLQSKLKDEESQLSALKEREAQRRNKSMRNGLEGRILAVNPSWNFVVLSLGDRNGVVNNSEMLIKRGAQLIGKVRITSVEPSTSIADIVANSVRSGLAVQPGDTVIYTGPGDDAEIKLP
jgi:myosin heavy subunit